MAIREAPARGRAGPVEEGRKAARRSGRSPASDAPWRAVGRRKASTPCPVVRASGDTIPESRPGFSGHLRTLPVQEAGKTTSPASPRAQAAAVTVWELGTLPLALASGLRLRALLLLELGPCAAVNPASLARVPGTPSAFSCLQVMWAGPVLPRENDQTLATWGMLCSCSHSVPTAS